LREAVKEQAVIHTDDTGWRVGGAPAYLMAFVNQALSVYQIRPRHRNEEVRELIPADFSGVMICDRGPSYDAREMEDIAQQKCLSHLIRNAKAVEESKTGRARQPRHGSRALRPGNVVSFVNVRTVQVIQPSPSIPAISRDMRLTREGAAFIARSAPISNSQARGMRI
jgi:hypothetical protein